MTREETKKLLPIIQAYAEGKAIEYSSDGKCWIEARYPSWNPYLIYRIKPEPKYRPFQNAEECWEEMQKHEPFGWIKAIPNEEYIAKYYPGSKDNNPLYYQVQKVAPGYIKYDDINDVCEIGEQDKSYKDVFGVMTFADGTPFGMKEE